MAQPEATVLRINSSLLTVTSNTTIDAKEQSLVVVLGSKRVSGLVSSAVRRVSILYIDYLRQLVGIDTSMGP